MARSLLGLQHPQTCLFPQLVSIKRLTLRMILESFKDTLKIFSQIGKINTPECQEKALNSDVSIKSFEWTLSLCDEAPSQAFGQKRRQACQRQTIIMFCHLKMAYSPCNHTCSSQTGLFWHYCMYRWWKWKQLELLANSDCQFCWTTNKILVKLHDRSKPKINVNLLNV